MTQPQPDIEAIKAFNAKIAEEFRTNNGKAGGADINPAWVHNLRANPRADVEIGTDSFDVVARELGVTEREEIIPKINATTSAFAEYQAKVSRVIPIFELQEDNS